MRKLILNIGLVLAIIYIVPFVVYGVGSVVAGLKPRKVHLQDAF